MTYEEMQRAMQFIINQQAQFVTDVDRLQEKIDNVTGVVTQLATLTLRRFEETDRKFDDVDRRIEALVDAQIRTEETVTRIGEELRNLIAVVDRYFSEGRDGR